MKHTLQKISEEAIRTSEPSELDWYESPNQEEKSARRLIAQSLIPAKTWAQHLGVTERVVQMWISGTKEMPPRRIGQVFKVGRTLLIRQKEAIDELIQELLDRAYGGIDKGIF